MEVGICWFALFGSFWYTFVGGLGQAYCAALILTSIDPHQQAASLDFVSELRKKKASLSMSSLLRSRLPCIRSSAVHRNLLYSSDGVMLLDRGEHTYCVTMQWLRSGCGVCIEDVAILPHELLDPPQDTQRQ